MPQPQRPRVTDENSRREGSRWVGERPSGEEVAAWFHDNVELDLGMTHEDHVAGITLISAKETRLEIVGGVFTDVERLVHVPYPRVDSRIRYFWMLCEARGWRGVIQPVAMPRVREPGMYNEHLPPGFSKIPVSLADRRVVTYIACTQKVTIYENAGRFERIVRDAPPATKQVPMVDRWGKPDDNAIMKAETSAIGRALGMAGIFVIPGAGVATAEDMQEYLANTGAAAGELAPTLPSDSAPEIDLDARIAELRAQIADADENHLLVEFNEWVGGRGFDLENLRESQKRGVLRRLEQLLGLA